MVIDLCNNSTVIRYNESMQSSIEDLLNNILYKGITLFWEWDGR